MFLSSSIKPSTEFLFVLQLLLCQVDGGFIKCNNTLPQCNQGENTAAVNEDGRARNNDACERETAKQKAPNLALMTRRQSCADDQHLRNGAHSTEVIVDFQ